MMQLFFWVQGRCDNGHLGCKKQMFSIFVSEVEPSTTFYSLVETTAKVNSLSLY
jgi:hypothetical protein